MNPERFSTTEICQALDIKYQRLREWIDRGYVVPTRRAEGSGDRTIFSRRGVYLVGLFNYLIVVDEFDRQVAAECVKGVESYLDATQTWDPISESAVLIFSREPWKPSGRNFESVKALLAEIGRSSKPRVRIVSEGMLRDLTIVDILSHKGFYQHWNDFGSLTIVNFRKIRELVDSKLN